MNHDGRDLKMQRVILIVATDLHGGIGKNGKIQWYCPEDLAAFRKETTPHAVIMGRKTFDSIGKPLPGRKNIVLSRTIPPMEGVTVVRSVESALEAASDHSCAYIMGGGEIYNLFLPFITEAQITRFTFIEESDTFFSAVDLEINLKNRGGFSHYVEKVPYGTIAHYKLRTHQQEKK